MFMWMSSYSSRNGKAPAVDLALDGVQALEDFLAVFPCNHALADQHPRMGAGARQVLRPEALVEADADIDRLHQLRRLGREPAAPHGLALSARRGLGLIGGVVGHMSEFQSDREEAARKLGPLKWVIGAGLLIGVAAVLYVIASGFVQTRRRPRPQ
jgi:hypothetical protein